jgi:hypothetical protein
MRHKAQQVASCLQQLINPLRRLRHPMSVQQVPGLSWCIHMIVSRTSHSNRVWRLTRSQLVAMRSTCYTTIEIVYVAYTQCINKKRTRIDGHDFASVSSRAARQRWPQEHEAKAQAVFNNSQPRSGRLLTHCYCPKCAVNFIKCTLTQDDQPQACHIKSSNYMPPRIVAK